MQKSAERVYAKRRDCHLPHGQRQARFTLHVTFASSAQRPEVNGIEEGNGATLLESDSNYLACNTFSPVHENEDGANKSRREEQKDGFAIVIVVLNKADLEPEANVHEVASEGGLIGHEIARTSVRRLDTQASHVGTHAITPRGRSCLPVSLTPASPILSHVCALTDNVI
ncbi:unnamed protein product [Protopolystoma xenopodis]|uniref:Uncharacterized protein n=1 Tax=Protopolystoma xenopodis TaxID=117903 RepID=A0A448X5Z7_9PLAT|nr:unnamed protein product [Protopolystoma xenopodis]